MTEKMQNCLILIEYFKKQVDKNFFFYNKEDFFLNNPIKRYNFINVKIL